MLNKMLGLVIIITFMSAAHARDQINIVGSSTVYPFAIVVAEKFGKTTETKYLAGLSIFFLCSYFAIILVS